MVRILTLAALLLAPTGCAHRVRIVSDPAGAQVRYRRAPVGPTPVEVTVWSVPFTHPTARVVLPGYRPMEVDLSADRRPCRRLGELLTLRWRKGLGLAPASTHEVMLVRQHGPLGTWDVEDVPE